MKESSNLSEISRRQLGVFFFGGIALGASCIVAGAFQELERRSNDKVTPPSEPERLESKYISYPFSSRLQLGMPEYAPINGLRNYPDIQVPTFIDSKSRLRGLVTAGSSAYLVDVSRNNGEMKIAKNEPILQPDLNIPYRNGYVGISSVTQPDVNNLDYLVGMINCEEHLDGDGEAFRGRIALGISEDGGNSWTDKGVIIEGFDPVPAGKPSPNANGQLRPTGAIQPWSIIKEENGIKRLYIYYTDLTSNIRRANDVHLTRAEIDEKGNLGEMELWTGDKSGFVPNGEAKHVEPAAVFTKDSGGVYTALASVYRYGQGYLGLFEQENGFYTMISQDAIRWSRQEKLIQTPIGVNRAKALGERWFTAPFIVNLDSSNQSIGNSGYLYWAESEPNDEFSKFSHRAHFVLKNS